MLNKVPFKCPFVYMLIDCENTHAELAAGENGKYTDSGMPRLSITPRKLRNRIFALPFFGTAGLLFISFLSAVNNLKLVF